MLKMRANQNNPTRTVGNVLQIPHTVLAILSPHLNGDQGKPGIVCLLTEPSGGTVGGGCTSSLPGDILPVMMGRRQKMDQDGYDVTSGWRHILVWARGEKKRIKRRMNKAFRREGKQEIQN